MGLNLEQQQQCLESRENKRNTSEGVGLTLCKSIVEAMGGTIGVESKPGRGTIFWFEIPFLRAAAPLPSMDSASAESKGSRWSDPAAKPQCLRKKSSSSLAPVPDEGGLNILLVDEDNVGRNITKTLLEQSGHTVSTVDSGDAMISAVSQETYDVILLEMQLPQSSETRNAADAAREIRIMGYSPEKLPILALTASVPRADYPELGLNDWLTKPIFIKDVQTAMTNAICNVGGASVGTGSVYDLDSQCSSLDGSAFSLHLSAQVGTAVGTDSSPSLPKRASFESLQSAFSDHLQTVMGSTNVPSNVTSMRSRGSSGDLLLLEDSHGSLMLEDHSLPCQ